jgi:hypothetical protein
VHVKVQNSKYFLRYGVCMLEFSKKLWLQHNWTQPHAYLRNLWLQHQLTACISCTHATCMQLVHVFFETLACNHCWMRWMCCRCTLRACTCPVHRLLHRVSTACRLWIWIHRSVGRCSCQLHKFGMVCICLHLAEGVAILHLFGKSSCHPHSYRLQCRCPLDTKRMAGRCDLASPLIPLSMPWQGICQKDRLGMGNTAAWW